MAKAKWRKTGCPEHMLTVLRPSTLKISVTCMLTVKPSCSMWPKDKSRFHVAVTIIQANPVCFPDFVQHTV